VMAAGFVPRAHPYIGMDEVADLLNAAAGRNVWDARQVRSTLSKAGGIVRIGHRWYTTRQRLREALPDLWGEILLHLDESE
jgi:hypothetical protein